MSWLHTVGSLMFSRVSFFLASRSVHITTICRSCCAAMLFLGIVSFRSTCWLSLCSMGHPSLMLLPCVKFPCSFWKAFWEEKCNNFGGNSGDGPRNDHTSRCERVRRSTHPDFLVLPNFLFILMMHIVVVHTQNTKRKQTHRSGRKR